LHARPQQRFCLVLIKLSHYDEDGYVIQWLRSSIPSNSLASLYGLAKDCAERAVLGADVEFEIHVYDETNARIRPARLARMIERAGAGMVMLAGVQSKQFPRALDIAKPLRFHVAGKHARRRRSRSGQGDWIYWCNVLEAVLYTLKREPLPVTAHFVKIDLRI
jgi:hypothetical protein